MLRFLNLNSPVPSPTQPFSPLSPITTNNTPNLSPVSATSTLMTPTDLSPATGFEKLGCHFDLTQSTPISQSHLFETSPSRLQIPSHSPTHRSFYAEHGNFRGYNAINLPYVDPFSNRSSSTYLPHGLSRGMDPTRSIGPSWNAPHTVGVIDWLRADDKVSEEAPTVIGARTLNVASFPAVQSAAHAHEVGIHSLCWHLAAIDLAYDCPSRSTFFRCCTRPLRPPTSSLSRVLSNHRISRPPSSCSRNLKLQMPTNAPRSSTPYVPVATR